MEWQTIETTTVRNAAGDVWVTDLKKLEAGKITVYEVSCIGPDDVHVRQFDKRCDAVDYYRKVQ